MKKYNVNLDLYHEEIGMLLDAIVHYRHDRKICINNIYADNEFDYEYQVSMLESDIVTLDSLYDKLLEVLRNGKL